MRHVTGRAIRGVVKSMGQRAWVELTLRYGKTFRHGSLVVTCEPEAVRALLLDKAHTEVRAPLHKMMGAIPGASGILFMDGEKWVTRTRAVMPAFHRDHVDVFAARLHAIVLAHLAQWQAGARAGDLYDAVQQIGVASVLEMGYGLEPHPLTAELGRALVEYKQFSMAADSRRRLDEFGVGLEKLLDLPWVLATLWGMHARAAQVRRAVRALVASGEPAAHRTGWLTLLARAGLSDADLAREINHLYGAFNAADYVVTAALCELARDRRLAEALRGELLSVLGDREPPARDDLPRLPWTNAFILEILRRYPVSMGIVRRTGEPIELGGERLSSGTQVLILLHALHHHPDFWDEPEALKPERWIGSPSPRVAFSYVPFLDGSRKCIGRSMAETHLLVVLSTIVRRIDIRVFREPIVPPFMIPRFGAPIPFAVEASFDARGLERHPSATLHQAAER